ncbi:hypothetical protein Pmi06nite_64800 [Planotetraspora mira]|uniref:Uncharacterized protein n=1 Tax=Planotetraspora mira TaxID=58121 RepID=A0A8J3TTW6_9ACTN|nr:hypothetical protein Pmi06nite_64800 [Planotetraspora mira]
MREHGGTGVEVRERRGLEHEAIAGCGPLAGGDLDDPGPVRRAAHERAGVVEGVDTVEHVGGEQCGQLAWVHPAAPVSPAVVADVVQAGGGHHMHPGLLADARDSYGVPAGRARHRVDHLASFYEAQAESTNFGGTAVSSLVYVHKCRVLSLLAQGFVSAGAELRQ